jgi:malate dehydrogenase (oxaloacetate-decarboxylating)(NADP+)
LRARLVGREDRIASQIHMICLRLQAGRYFDLVETDDEALISSAADEFYKSNRRKGASRQSAAATVKANSTLLARSCSTAGKADGMLCGMHGAYADHLEFVATTVGLKPGARQHMVRQRGRIAVARGASFSLLATAIYSAASGDA